MKTKFFKCETCGNVAIKVVDSNVPLVCCGKPMTELRANTEESVTEKHLPVVRRLDDHRIEIRVGSIAHPMTPEHHIAFIYVETDTGGIRIDLKDSPEAVVCVGESKVRAVYEYCNIHGLWMSEM